MAENSIEKAIKFTSENIKDFSIICNKKISGAWEYFGTLYYKNKTACKLEKKYCRLCLLNLQSRVDTDPSCSSFQIKSYAKSVSTGNLAHHLYDDHSVDVNNKTTFAKTRKLENFFTPLKRQRRSEYEEKYVFGRQLVLWCCRDLLPFSFASGEGFIDFMKSQGIDLKKNNIPSATTIARSALSDVYKVMKARVQENLTKDFATLTFDMWTDDYRKRSYITFTWHQIVNFELQKFTLSTKLITGSHTGENIKTEIVSVLQLFNIDAKKLFAVTDAGKNVVKAARLAEMEHHKCLGHGLHNLIMVDGIKSVTALHDTIGVMRKAVTAVRYKAPQLEEIQKEDLCTQKNRMSIDLSIFDEDAFDEFAASDETLSPDTECASSTTTVKTESPTRWHSLLTMLESLQKTKSAVIQLLLTIDSDVEIGKRHWEVATELIALLQSFKKTVEILSQDKNCTINTALLLRSELKSILENVNDKDSISIVELKQNMLTNFDKRFPLTDLIVLGAILDPRYKHLRAVEQYLKSVEMTEQNDLTSMSSFLLQKLRELEIDDNCETITENDCVSNTKTNSNTIFIKEVAKKHLSHSFLDSNSKFKQECQRYSSITIDEFDDNFDILKFWASMKISLPRLSRFASCILCIPCTSTPSERVFSVAGSIINKKRSSLNPAHVDKMIFIHDNYTYYKNITKNEQILQ